MIDIRHDVPGLWCDDITFCPEKCEWNQCPRNQKNIRDRTVPHSFSIDIPGDCPKLLEGRLCVMVNREKVIAGLTMLVDRKNDDTCEGLKCCKIAKDALALLKEHESEEKRILKIVWDILHSGVSTDTEADQDWVYEQIRNQVHQVY